LDELLFARVLARLDYVLTDTMDLPRPQWPTHEAVGKRRRDWRPGNVHEKYVEWHLQIISTQPIDLWPTRHGCPNPWPLSTSATGHRPELAKCLRRLLSTSRPGNQFRFQPAENAFLEDGERSWHQVFARLNGRYPKMGQLEYSVQMAKELKLEAKDMFIPAPDGQKAVQRRKNC